jgi:hypothetical protein
VPPTSTPSLYAIPSSLFYAATGANVPAR